MAGAAITTVETYFDALDTHDMDQILVHFAPDTAW
jgi:ketosteroid isomerase-like protein